MLRTILLSEVRSKPYRTKLSTKNKEQLPHPPSISIKKKRTTTPPPFHRSLPLRRSMHPPISEKTRTIFLETRPVPHLSGKTTPCARPGVPSSSGAAQRAPAWGRPEARHFENHGVKKRKTAFGGTYFGGRPPIVWFPTSEFEYPPPPHLITNP